MSDCETCKKVRDSLVVRIKHPIQRFLRTISGSQRWFDGQGTMIGHLMEAGASLESALLTHETATTKWFENHESRVARLEAQNMQLKEKLRDYEKRMSSLEGTLRGVYTGAPE